MYGTLNMEQSSYRHDIHFTHNTTTFMKKNENFPISTEQQLTVEGQSVLAISVNRLLLLLRSETLLEYVLLPFCCLAS